MNRHLQEAKVVNLDDDSEVFFFAHGFKTSAMHHAKKYMERNKGKFAMKLYRLNNAPYLWKTETGDNKWLEA